jgi:hypothetical protein
VGQREDVFITEGEPFPHGFEQAAPGKVFSVIPKKEIVGNFAGKTLADEGSMKKSVAAKRG